MRATRILPSIIALAALGAASLPAHAQHLEGRAGFHGDIGRFHEHDWAVWHGGHWEHSFHDGRWGWWWLAGGAWYFYPYPIYPYPDPYVPPVVTAPVLTAPEPVPPPPTPSAWYYCASARGYYPYVPSCPEGWRATAPNSAAPPAAAPPAAPPPAPTQ